MKHQVFGTVREAIHHTATASGVPMKALAADLDLSPSNLSMRTTLGTDGIPFPADDRLVLLQKLTGDCSILSTMAASLGFELHPLQERLPELVAQLVAEHKRLSESVQLVLATPWINPPRDSGSQQKKGR